ncbi:MAG: succinylglutamate desuccinylase/aspartoacylase family protein [Deltaproteobacteria bacterium]|nr:succinylglutamate desuccinylase/aspartoacylase family protein [Deltaproteobacteria bacterium]
MIRIFAVVFLVVLSLQPASLVAAQSSGAWDAIELIGRTVASGEKRKFSFTPKGTFEGFYLDVPVFVARGAAPGATLCVTAGIHGDEMNGVEVARRVFAKIDPMNLAGTLIVLPLINVNGFRVGSRYLPDRRDLNRYFPGRIDGSVASIIANAFFSNIILRCNALVDLHSGSFRLSMLPQIRVDLSQKDAVELAHVFGVGIIVGGAGPSKSLRRAAMNAGIPAITYEAGESLRFQPKEIARGVEGVKNVMVYIDMIEGTHHEVPKSHICDRSRWVRVPRGQSGFFFPERELGSEISSGDRLGYVVDPLTDERYDIIAPYGGYIIGMAVPQVVLSGYALFNLGLHDE